MLLQHNSSSPELKYSTTSTTVQILLFLFQQQQQLESAEVSGWLLPPASRSCRSFSGYRCDPCSWFLFQIEWFSVCTSTSSLWLQETATDCYQSLYALLLFCTTVVIEINHKDKWLLTCLKSSPHDVAFVWATSWTWKSLWWRWFKPVLLLLFFVEINADYD